MAGVSTLTAIRLRAGTKSPLYAYRVTDQEFGLLRDELRDELRRTDSVRGALAGMFCLFASEQLCRGYHGGPWTWKLVLDPLQWEPSFSRLSAAVHAGLTYWQRPVISTGTQQRMLSTLVCEGGLPLHLLAEDRERHIKLFFRSLIQRVERYGGAAIGFIEDQLPLLPSSFRNDTVCELASMLADEIVKLRQLLPADLSGDPLEYLGRNVPAWSAAVPMRVTDAAFSELLRGLLTQPREQLQAALPIELMTILYRTAPVRIERRAALLKEASLESMAQLFGVSSDTISSHARILLSLVSSDGERYPIAIARMHQDQKSFRLERLPFNPIRHDSVVAQRVLISATVGGHEVACTEVSGGQPLLPDVPWVFEGGDRPESELLVQGSYRTSSTELLVAVPSTATLDVLAGESADTALRVRNRAVRVVSGRALIRVVDEEWFVSTGTEAEQDQTYVFVGKLERAGFSGSEFWRGFPGVHLVKQTGRRSEVSQTQIQVRPVGTGQWWNCSDAVGDLDVRIRDCERTTFRARIITLPPATKVQLNPIDSTVTVVSSELLEARLAMGPATEAIAGTCRLTLPAGCASMSIALHLTFRRGRVTLMVPSPLRKAEFVGRHGATEGPLVLDRVGQIRARAVSPDASEHFVLEARIQGRTRWLPIARLLRSSASHGVWELGLESVRAQLEDLFASTDALDAQVELQLISSARRNTHQRLTLRRYEAKPVPIWTDHHLELELEPDAEARLGPMALELLELGLRPVLEPDQPPQPITRDGNRWRVAASELAACPAWLVTGHIRDLIRLRPLLIMPRDAEKRPARNALEKWALESDRTTRRSGLEAVLKEMASSWNTPEWDHLAKFLSMFESLPATTFDVIGALARVPEAATSALFRCGGSTDAFGKTWRGMQELPFLWEAVPVSAWETAANSLSRWAAECAEAAGSIAVRKVMTELYSDVLMDPDSHRTPFLGVLHDLFAKTIPYVRRPAQPYLSASPEMLHGLLYEEARAMLARHDGELWPTDLEPICTTAGELDLGDMLPDRGFRELGSADHRPVLRMPFLLGLAVGGDELTAAMSLLSLKRVKTFDSPWFEVAHAVGFALTAGQRRT